MEKFNRLSALFIATIMAFGVGCGSKESPANDEVEESFPPSASLDNSSTHASTMNKQPLVDVPVDDATGDEEEPAQLTPMPVEPEPTTFSGFMERGRALSKSDDYSGAVDDFRKALEMRPDNVNARLQLGRALLSAGKLDEAREHIETVLEDDAASSLSWNTMGRLELAEKNYEAAITSFERATEENPDNSYAWNNLGFVHLELEDHESAVDALEQATSGANPTHYMWNNLGMAYEHLDRIVEARAAYRQGMEAGSERARSNFERLEGVVSLVNEVDDEEQVIEESIEVESPEEILEEVEILDGGVEIEE